MSISKRTTIQVSQECKDAIAAFGKKGDSYEDILWTFLKGPMYHWENVHRISMPFSTEKGIEYMDIIIPKVNAMNIDEDEFRDTVGKVCEDNNIRILDDSEVPFFNDHF